MDRGSPERMTAEDRPPLSDETHLLLDAWVRRHVEATAHERRVAQIAEALFDLTADLHGLRRRSLWMLIAAAIVHDVGRGVDPEDHARIGADLILSDETLSLTPATRRSLAYLTLYHRGAVPEPGHDELLRPGDDHQELLKILAMLRAADTLDSRSIHPPRLMLVRRQRDLQIRCLLRAPDWRAERSFRRPKKYRLLERVLDCRVDVQVECGEARMLFR